LRRRGYTLVELIVVLFIASLLLFLAAPNLRRAFLDDQLVSTGKKLIALAQELRADAVREQLTYCLHIDLDQGRYWTSSTDMTPAKRDERKKAATSFPEDVKVTDGYPVGDEKKTEGELTVLFFKNGVVQPTVLHLGNGDEHLTLFFEPFINRIRMLKEYIDFPEKTE